MGPRYRIKNNPTRFMEPYKTPWRETLKEALEDANRIHDEEIVPSKLHVDIDPGEMKTKIYAQEVSSPFKGLGEPQDPPRKPIKGKMSQCGCRTLYLSEKNPDPVLVVEHYPCKGPLNRIVDQEPNTSLEEDTHLSPPVSKVMDLPGLC